MIGLIGGVSAEATQIYYRHLNAHARSHLGGQHTANVLFYMLDYGVMIDHYHEQNWDAFVQEVVKGAECLKLGGARALAITSGTTHVGAAAAASATGLPVIHMIDALAAALSHANAKAPLLLGTPWVMTGEFFAPELAGRYAGKPVIPEQDDIGLVGQIIFDELVNGQVVAASQEKLMAMLAKYADAGADCVILGCTELCMIISDEISPMPVFDVTEIHAKAIAEKMYGPRG